MDLDVTVVVLTKNEHLHIGRCLAKLSQLAPRQVFIIDSFSTDDTQKIITAAAESLSIPVQTVEHEWPGDQARQFNWALDSLPIKSSWILRLDADEWLTDALTDEIKVKLPQLPDDVDGVVLKRRHLVGWLGGKWIKHGMYPTRILRLFRTGHARYAEDMAMDEHLIIEKKAVEFDNDFVDESLISFENWQGKHRNYAKREALMAVSNNVNPNKRIYYKLPPYFRAFAYFCVRYIFKLGFLDGTPGLLWHFWQGLWYRWLVDIEISAMKMHFGRNCQ